MSRDTFYEAVEDFLNQEEIHRFEGDSGLQNLETLLEAIGYEGHGFRFGSVLESFLSDNPGAVEALVEWLMCVDSVPEWKERLEERLDG